MTATNAAGAKGELFRDGTNGISCTAPVGAVCTSRNPNGVDTHYEYWVAGSLETGDVKKIDRPAPLGDVQMEYDAVSRVTKVIDGKGQATLYAYDNLDRVTEITYQADSTSIEFTYDDNGNVTQRVDRDTSTWTMGYDDANRLTSSSGPNESVTYTYDPVGNLASMSDGSGTRTYTYTPVNMVATVTNANSQTTTMTYEPYNSTRRTKVAYPNGVELRMTYDLSGRIETIESFNTNPNPDVRLTSFEYTYTNGTVDTGKRQVVTTPDGYTAYTYGTDERLTGATFDPNAPGPNDVRSWVYDPAGNITSTTVAATTTTFTHNDADQLTSGAAAYDANGNQTATSGYGFTAIGYNPADQSTSMTPTGGTATALTYAGQSQDHLRTAGGSQITTAASMGVTRTTAGSDTWTFTREPSGTLVDLRYNSNTYFYVFDGQGSVVGLTDASGNLVNTYRYDPYGKRLAATEAVYNPYQFQAGATFTNGTTYKYGTRWYDTTTGTWTQLDPTGADPGYTFTGGDPINRTDPTGRYFGEDFVEGIKCEFEDAFAIGRNLPCGSDGASGEIMGNEAFMGCVNTAAGPYAIGIAPFGTTGLLKYVYNEGVAGGEIAGALDCATLIL